MARSLWLQALDRWSVLDVDSANKLLRGSSLADPGYLPAYLDQLEMAAYFGTAVQLREQHARRTDLPQAVHECVSLLLRMHDSHEPALVAPAKALAQRFGRQPCFDYVLARALSITRTLSTDELVAARSAATEFPEHPATVGQLVSLLRQIGRSDEAASMVETAAGRQTHILGAIRFRAEHAGQLRAAGDTAGAAAIARSLERQVGRDRRPFVRYQYRERFLVLLEPERSGAERSAILQMALTDAAKAPALAAHAAIHVAGPLVDHGRVREALRVLAPHIAYVERQRLYNHQVRIRLIEGRALARAGRNAEAIQALVKAREAATRVGSAQLLAQVHHQTMHAFEGLGRWREASAAAKQYIAYSQRAADPGPRVMSYHDAAAVHWKAGWHAASDSLSRLMVAAIERERLHYAYAAEYFERVGDLGRALAYLRRSLLPDVNGHIADEKVTYSALTRLHLTLGNRDSALAAARHHDSLGTTYDELLIPRALVAAGKLREASDVMRGWTRLQSDRGNVRGHLKALLGLVAVLEQSPAEAIAAARDAEAVASSHGFTLERIMAMRARGEASRRLGRPDAEAILRDASALARNHPDAMERILVEIALGDALSARKEHAEAIASYRVAIDLIERSGATIRDDVTSARFKAARRAAFDGALRSVAASMPAVDDLLRWSARKKVTWGQGGATRSGLAALQSRLGRGVALIDFVVIDSVIVASVVTSASASTARLAMPPQEVLASSRALVRPLASVYGGRIDLARAHVDEAAARRLYDGLLRPLEKLLAGVHRLVIVPDAPLHGVPFDVLIASRTNGQLTYAVDRWAISYALAPVISVTPRRIRAADRLLFVAGEAPGAQDERAMVQSSWRGPVEALANADGNESTVLRRARSFPILHIAAHARSSERDPLASYLALAPSATHDGLLHYAEIEAARMRHALVVLNACETSAGELLAGSGLMSLARAFLVSGSEAVVATQWPVGAASAKLSGWFYDAIREGAALDEALRGAKLKLRAERATAHPFFWASHVVIASL